MGEHTKANGFPESFEEKRARESEQRVRDCLAFCAGESLPEGGLKKLKEELEVRRKFTQRVALGGCTCHEGFIGDHGQHCPVVLEGKIAKLKADADARVAEQMECVAALKADAEKLRRLHAEAIRGLDESENEAATLQATAEKLTARCGGLGVELATVKQALQSSGVRCRQLEKALGEGHRLLEAVVPKKQNDWIQWAVRSGDAVYTRAAAAFGVLGDALQPTPTTEAIAEEVKREEDFDNGPFGVGA